MNILHVNRLLLIGAIGLCAHIGAIAPQAQLIEAESATLLTGVEIVADTGASGGFRVRNFDEAGDSLRFDSVPSGVRIKIDFSLSRDNIKQCSLYVNGNDVYTLTFNPTSGWTNYLSKQFYIPVGGTVELRIDADDHAANRNDTCAAIDSIEIFQTTVTTEKAFVDVNGRVVYSPFTDNYGDHYIGDYSNCGYGGGGRGLLPDESVIPIMATVVSPGVGIDAGPAIQAAINTVSALPLNNLGFRGAVLLQAGRYEIPGTLTISASGVVLRGEGDGSDETTDTILVGTGVDPAQRTLITIAGNGFFGEVSGSSQDIIDDYLPSFSRSFNVADASGFSPGDTVIVLHESPQTWINEIGMNLLDNPWMPGERDLRFDRIITKIEGNRITIDAPLPSAFDQEIDGGGRIYKYTRSSAGRITQSGIEHLRILSEFTSATDEDHMGSCVAFDDIEHGWARKITGEGFVFGTVRLQTGAKWITVVDCAGIDPVSQVTGGRRYPFVNERGQLTLVRRCFARAGRHDFVFQSTVPGPNAFVDCATQDSRNDTGPHQRWTAGALFDNVLVYGHDLNIRDRQNSGSGHGWAGANQTVWNARADDFIIEQPPTAQNWAIGTVGNSRSGDGYFEANGTHVSPTSLYDAQLAERLALLMPGAVVYEEGVTSSLPQLPAAENFVITLQAPVKVTTVGPLGDRTYECAITTADGTSHLAIRLDANTNNTLMVAEVKGPGGTHQATVPLSIDLAGYAVDFTMHASFEIRAGTTDVYYKLIREDIGAVVWDSNTTLAAVPSGVLNQLTKSMSAAATGSMGNVKVALGQLHQFAAVADAAVSQASPAANFGDAPGLRLNTSSTDQYDAYLKFDVTGVAGDFDIVRLRLHSDSLNGSVRAYRVADTAWSEAGINWSNRPAMGLPLDYEAALLPGTAFTIDASAHIATEGVYTIGLENDTGGAGALNLSSAESTNEANVPRLEIIGDAIVPVPSPPSGLRLH